MAQVQEWSDNLISELCNGLKERRLQLSLSIYRLSQESGVSEPAIAFYESHQRRPVVDSIAKLSWALGLMPSELLALAEERAGKPPKQPGKPKRAP